MILKALYDYYHRSGDNVAPLGLEYKEIGFIIVIDKDGNLCRICLLYTSPSPRD